MGSQIADFVVFEEGGTRTIAANIPGRATAVVHLSPGAERDTALQILRSIRTDQGESNE